MIPASAYAAQSAKSPLTPFQFERRDVQPHDVQIEVLFCGVCHSDLHQARNEWHNSHYPMVPGHEIIGRVTAVGAHVSKFKVGDLAGVGCMVDSCQHCPACADGLEQYCANGASYTYNSTEQNSKEATQGGYSSVMVVREEFVVKVSDALDLASAAPLLCAGITMYSPLRHWRVEAGQEVGIIGLGGLGHIGVKLAKAMGARVTVFTTSASKAADAHTLGADAVILSTDAAAMKAAKSTFHLLLDTVPRTHDLNLYLPLVKLDGALVIVGALEPLEPGIHGGTLIGQRRTVAGSGIGGIAETQEMFDFCAQHGIGCDVEVIAMDTINAAYERLLKNDVKYRFVIDMATLVKG
ncbi:MAG: NAD(P)-dependent alcohol dehydrogenase [Hymenobacteraceae bacterium]|nr:NAD(P)-dependent alcohol dehydrogenase [Hymenobacteraceae bacterium]